jgi:hypothetical protein
VVRDMAASREQFMKFYAFREVPLDQLAFFEHPLRGKWHRIQRWCFKILRYLGAYRKEFGVERYEVDCKSLLDGIMEHPGRELRRLIEYREFKYILVGYHQARDIIRGLNHDYYHEIPSLHDTTTRVHLNGLEYHRVLAGMQLIVVPWFDGILLLPELGEMR